MRALLAVLLLTLSGMTLAQGFSANSPMPSLGPGFEQPEFLPVTEAYQLEVDLLPEQRGLRLYWSIADAYYLYQHSFKFVLETASGPAKLQISLPEGLAKTDEFFGDVVVYYNNADVSVTVDEPIERGFLSVTSQGCADAGLCYPPYTQYFNVDMTSGTVSAADPPPTPLDALASTQPVSQGSTGSGTLLTMLVLAFLGGAILNLMPCVFPILSLKVLSFARSTDHDRHLHSWLYTAGVVLSFVLVAALLIALQQAGQAIGWGFQLQSPTFVIALAYLFIAMGLSLSGVIEFGGSLMNAGSGLANRGGYSGSFFTGVLAVIVASPCTAPFMGTALGFAVGQPAPIALLVFAALGAGMAAPLLFFSYSGAARALMPKPGPWMETLKEFLAFPLYATALWLLWVAGRQTGINTMTLALVGALLLALALWLWDERRWRKVVALLCLIAAVTLGAQRGFDAPTQASALAVGKVAWSEHGVSTLRSEGTPVFVDVTADWCITCKANEAAVLFTDEISAAFADSGVAYMIADWTNRDADIAALLRRYERSGIPLYLMYPADPEAEPTILPQILTKSIVLNAIAAVSVRNPDDALVFQEDDAF